MVWRRKESIPITRWPLLSDLSAEHGSAKELSSGDSVRGTINETNHQTNDHPFHEVSDPLLDG